MICCEDYYKILGVNSDATSKEIQKAYRERCFDLHPDRLVDASAEVKKKAEKELVIVNRAYDVLKNYLEKRVYDSEWFRTKSKPKPIVSPSHIIFRDMEPGEVGKASFVIDNAGGRYARLNVSNPSSWVRVVDHCYINATEGLVRGVQIEAQGEDWEKNYSESIQVKLDEEEAQVTIELQTKPFPGPVSGWLNTEPALKSNTMWRIQSDVKPQMKSHRSSVVSPIFGLILLVALIVAGIYLFNDSQDKIVFQSGNSEIYVVNANGDNLRQLTNNPAQDRYPAWSSDGRKIVFQSDCDGNPEIYVMNADGTNLTRLTAQSAPDQNPVWSPDGRKIAFQSDRDGNSEIYVMNADGTSKKCLTNHFAMDWHPVWSPDGRKIAFQSDRDGNSELYVLNADGGRDLRRLTRNPARESHPVWSTDGGKIFFQSSWNNISELYIMDADGDNLIPLTHTVSGMESSPAADEDNFLETYALSPDGSKIAFQSNRDGNFDIYVMNLKDSNLLCLTNNPASEKHPKWSPDSKKIAFQSDRDGGYGIYVVDSDGKNSNKIVSNITFDGYFMWSTNSYGLSFSNIVQWDELISGLKAKFHSDEIPR